MMTDKDQFFNDPFFMKFSAGFIVASATSTSIN